MPSRLVPGYLVHCSRKSLLPEQLTWIGFRFAKRIFLVENLPR